MEKRSRQDNRPEKDRPGGAVYACLPIYGADTLEALRGAAAELPEKDESRYHVTLRHIAGVSAAGLGELSEALEAACSVRTPFELALDRPGVFPNAPGVIYYGVAPSAQLSDLQAAIDRAVRNLGWPAADYAYNPHITLARGAGRAREVPPAGWLAETVEIRRAGKGGEAPGILASFRLGGN